MQPQWFYIQRLSAAGDGGTNAQYFGPFYGNPQAILQFTGSRDYVLIYANGKWADVRGLPIPGG